MLKDSNFDKIEKKRIMSISNMEDFTVNQAIDRLGFGYYQIILSFIVGMAWVADAMEMMILRFAEIFNAKVFLMTKLSILSYVCCKSICLFTSKLKLSNLCALLQGCVQK